MKKKLLAIIFTTISYWAVAQATVAGVYPSSIAISFDFGVQANAGGWPGENDDGTWGFDGSGLDFNNPGDHIIASLMIVDDGSSGTNPQGNPVSAEGCNPIQNDLTGKIAVIYRNECFFSDKIYYAQEAGAVAVIIINREEEVIGMLASNNGGTPPDGILCTIPAVFISATDGQALVSEIQNGVDVVMFIGNKCSAFDNDAGISKSSSLVSTYGSIPKNMAEFNGYTFELGSEVINYGVNSNNFELTATLEGPNGVISVQVIQTGLMNTCDTIMFSNISTPSFNPISLNTWDLGEYTLTYDLSLNGAADDANYDNTISSTFNVTSDILSLASIDTTTSELKYGGFPYNSEDDQGNLIGNYQSCMGFQDQYTSGTANWTGIEGIYFSANKANDTINEGFEITANLFEWNDPTWTSFSDRKSIGFGSVYLDSSQYRTNTFIPFVDNNDDPEIVQLKVNQRYLVCLSTYDPFGSFGYDKTINYSKNEEFFDQRVCPIYIEDLNGAGVWYTGWNSYSAPAFGLKTVFNFSPNGIEENAAFSTFTYPNPAKTTVNITANTTDSNAELSVLDVSGRIITSNKTIKLIKGQTTVNVSDLNNGIYIFSLKLRDGRTSQFNVVIAK